MKKYLKNSFSVFLASGGMALVAGNAHAALSMQEREHVQTIVWVTEAVTVVTIVAIFLFVWRISRRELKNRKSKQEKLTE